jgi:hypothetical protein
MSPNSSTSHEGELQTSDFFPESHVIKDTERRRYLLDDDRPDTQVRWGLSKVFRLFFIMLRLIH